MKDGYNLKHYKETEVDGDFGMPTIKATDFKPDRVIGFNEMLSAKSNDCGIHFFLDDYQFERVWNRPQYYLSRMRNFQCIFTPDFSLYTDMAMPVLIWNTYRSRLIGQMAHREGLRVIPTVSWSTPDSYRFCFDGLPRGGQLQLAQLESKKVKEINCSRMGLKP